MDPRFLSKPAPSAPMLPLLLLSACSDYQVNEKEFIDIFEQSAADEVDVLLVVDNSVSMAPYQELLGENLGAFLTYFSGFGVDYRIGVVTTDVFAEGAGVVRGEVVTSTTQNADEVFASSVAVGTDGSGAEMGLEAARLALIDPDVSAKNAGFLRSTAYMTIVWVSDEDDASPGSVDEYVRAYQGVKSDTREAFNASALVVHDADDCYRELSAESVQGVRYELAADHSGGVYRDLCAEDFAGIVADVSLSASRLHDTFYLSALPKASSLEVEVDGAPIPCDVGDWRYSLLQVDGRDAGAIVFESASMPPVGARIAVRYNQGSGEESTFCTGD